MGVLSNKQLGLIFGVRPMKKTKKKRAKWAGKASGGGSCPKCHLVMQRRTHLANETAYLKKFYYYSEWDYCPHCKHVQHYEKYKVYNTPWGRERALASPLDREFERKINDDRD